MVLPRMVPRVECCGRKFRDRLKSRKQSEQLFKLKYIPKERRQRQVRSCCVSLIYLSGYMSCRNEEMNIQLFGEGFVHLSPDFHPRSILLKGGEVLVLI